MNAGKHAQATQIFIHLSKTDGIWQLTVNDDGIGLPDTKNKVRGMGMRIMQYRARIIQGTLTVTNAPRGGVLVNCTAPAGEP